MEQVKYNGKEIDIFLISSIVTPAFERLRSIILSETSSVVGLDAEWRPQKTSKPKTSAVGIDAEGKPQKTSEPKASSVGLDAEGKSDETRQSEFTQVCVLQIACLRNTGSPVVFLLDLLKWPLDDSSKFEIHKLLKVMFKAPNIVKLGYGFKQDFQNISDTFRSHFKLEGFDQVVRYLDIFDINNKTLSMQQKALTKQREKLSVIYEKFIGHPLSKEHQQSDWSERPLKKELMEYAAIDAYCLIEILDVYCRKFLKKGGLSYYVAEPGLPLSESSRNTITIEDLFQIVTDCEGMMYSASGNIVLKESDSLPRSRINNGGQSSAQPISRRPWDCSLGGDGRPKFLCDAMMEDLFRLLRLYGIDTKIAHWIFGYESSSTADLIQQAEEERRMFLTAAKRGTHASPNYYKLKRRFKKDQLLDFKLVFKAFGLGKIKDQISRCTKCDRWIKLYCPLTPSEAIEAAEGDNPLGWCMYCQDRYARYLYVDDKGVLRLDYMWLEMVGL